MKKFPHWATIFWVVIIAVSYGFTVWNASFNLRHLPDNNLRMQDSPDGDVLMNGIHANPNFSDTYKWWTGSWIAGDHIYFYRPLTSLAWWFEYKLFGENGATAFMLIHWMLLAIVTALLFIFFRRLFGLNVSGLATTIWVSGVLDRLTLPSLMASPKHWKNDPECWVSICILSCMLLLSNYWRTEKRGYAIGALAAFVIGVCFKEMAYVMPFLAAWLWWHQRREHQGAKLWPVVSLYGLAVVLFCYRIWAIGEKLPRNSNHSWPERALVNLVGGRAAATVNGEEYVPLAIALAVFGAIFLYRRRWLAGVPFLLAAGICVWRNDANAEFPFDAALKLMNIWPLHAAVIYADAALAIVFVFLWTNFMSQRDQIRVFAYGWLFFAYLPILTSPIGPHAFFFPSTGWALWMAIPVLAFARRARGRLQPLRSKFIDPPATPGAVPATVSTE